jgi:hypothetical protein
MLQETTGGGFALIGHRDAVKGAMTVPLAGQSDDNGQRASKQLFEMG